MEILILLVVVVSAIWVAVDAKNNKIPIDKKAYSANNGALPWLLTTLLFWIVGFPYYLIKRSRVMNKRQAEGKNVGMQNQPKLSCNLEGCLAVSNVPQKGSERRMKVGIPVVVLLVIGLGVFFGTCHVATGVGNALGVSIIPRSSFGFSEVFINAEEITGMPYIFAKAKYPRGVKALQRGGYIESEQNFNGRVIQEVQKGVQTLFNEYDQATKQREEGDVNEVGPDGVTRGGGG